MYNRLQTEVLSICLILAMSGFIVAFSMPVATPIIVSFGQTETETAAIGVLQEEIPNAIVVGFGGFEYNNLKARAVGPVVYVGHGSDEGIQNGNALISTERMGVELKTCTASKIIILACNSRIIAAQDKTGRTYGFGSFIDAELAALETVIRIDIFYGNIDSAFRAFDRFLETARDKISGDSEILPLYADMGDGGGGGGSGGGGTPAPAPYFSHDELMSAIWIFMLGCIFALVGFAISCGIQELGDSIARQIGYYTVGTVTLTKMQTIFSLVKTYGLSFLNNAVATVYGGYPSMVQAWLSTTVAVLSDWTSHMSVGEWVIFIGICALEILIIILTAGAEATIRLAAGIAFAILKSTTCAVADGIDPDGTPCRSILQACSEFLG